MECVPGLVGFIGIIGMGRDRRDLWDYRVFRGL